MLDEQHLAMGFALYFLFATTVMFVLNRMLNGKRKPQVITIDLVMSMPTHDSFRLRSYDLNDEQESFVFCDFHYERDCACLLLPEYNDIHNPYEVVLPIHEHTYTEWRDRYPYDWRMRLNAQAGRKTKANK